MTHPTDQPLPCPFCGCTNGTDEQLRAYVAAERERWAAEIARLRTELANEKARDIHSCHADCTRAGCVNRRLRAEVERLRAELADAALTNRKD